MTTCCTNIALNTSLHAMLLIMTCYRLGNGNYIYNIKTMRLFFYRKKYTKRVGCLKWHVRRLFKSIFKKCRRIWVIIIRKSIWQTNWKVDRIVNSLHEKPGLVRRSFLGTDTKSNWNGTDDHAIRPETDKTLFTSSR